MACLLFSHSLALSLSPCLYLVVILSVATFRLSPHSHPAGGIAPKILPAMLDNSLFYANLVAKGRMKSLLSAIPVYIVTHPQVGA